MHSLLILVLILDALIAVSSVLNLVNMVRVNLLVEEKQAQALTVQLVRVCKTSAGKGGLLSSWFGVYACPGEIGTGEFTSTNPYGSPEAVPKATTVVPMKASGVLEHCDIGAHLGRPSGAAVAYGRRLFSAAGSVYPPVRHFLWTFRRSADGLPADPQADRQHSAGKI